MIKRLDETLKKYEELIEKLSTEEVIKNIEQMKELSKEKAALEEIVLVYKKYKEILKQQKENEELLNDMELVELAREELNLLEEKEKNLRNELEKLLIPKEENDSKNIIMEIRGAAGGDEANIFAGDLFEMYSKFAVNEGYQVEVINSVACQAGGYSQIEFIVKGKNAYLKLKYENGAHRVQRVPATESQGRVHTSTATVVVLPEREDKQIEIKENDLKIDVYRSGGAGGQSVNTTDSAVRITHLPTGIVVTCQNERSQLKNKEKAMQILTSKIIEEKEREQEQKYGQLRKTKIGTGDRSEKIRTYNYPQNRITDHQINLTLMHLDRIMAGGLGELINELVNEDVRRKLAGE